MSQMVKMLKKDAAIPLTVGAGFFQKLTTLLVYLVEQQSEEEIALLQTLASENKELPEPWMENIQTVMTLLNELEKSAESNGLMYETSIDEADDPTIQ